MVRKIKTCNRKYLVLYKTHDRSEFSTFCLFQLHKKLSLRNEEETEPAHIHTLTSSHRHTPRHTAGTNVVGKLFHSHTLRFIPLVRHKGKYQI